MKVLGIVGSSRREGNTSALVNRAARGFEKRYRKFAEMMADDKADISRVINLGDYEFRGCNGCEACSENFKCVVDDDMQKIYPLLEEAEVLILGSPAYFYNITADLKAMIDRCYCWEAFSQRDRSVWLGLNELRPTKLAGVIAVSEQEGAEGMGFTVKTMKKPLQALGYSVKMELEARGYFHKGEVGEDEKMMKAAEKAGSKLAEAFKLKLKAAKKLR